jgi:hypothetical protein
MEGVVGDCRNVFIDLNVDLSQVRIVWIVCDDELYFAFGSCALDVGVLERSVEASSLVLPAQLADRTVKSRDLVLVDFAGFDPTDEVGVGNAELAGAVEEGPVEYVDDGVIDGERRLLLGGSCFVEA